jgi:DNA-binding response OmpR family regulator
MTNLLIITQDSSTQESLYNSLEKEGFTCLVTSYNEVTGMSVHRSTDLILVETASQLPDSSTWELIRAIKEEKQLPVIALIPAGTLSSINGQFIGDDFITYPFDTAELILRIKRLVPGRVINETDELIVCDELVINLARCEVTVENKVVELTYKEYELLKFLASNKGRVYSRQVLLDKVWGYDYYGGDRTVDVHIRRLRSKIEDLKHTYVETVRNIGYRFKAE